MTSAFSAKREIAELLHNKQCRLNHIDACDWFYCSWEKPQYSRERYLEKAAKVLNASAGIALDDLIKILEEI